MKTIYILTAIDEERHEALIAFEDYGEALSVLEHITEYHEPFYEKWARDWGRSMNPEYAKAAAAHPARVYDNCPCLTNVYEFDLQEIHLSPAKQKAEFPPATCGCDSYPVTWTRGQNLTWICSADLPGSLKVYGNGPTQEEALIVLRMNIETTKAELAALNRK